MGEAALKLSSERSYWFINQGDEIVGPLLGSQVLDQLRSSKLGPSDFCWKEGFSEWRPLASVNDFSSACHGKKFIPVIYPKVAVPSHSQDSGKRRRSTDNMTMLTLAPENRKVVQVNFAKTRVRRLSIYEWAFAMGFAMICTYVGSALTVDAILGRVEQIRQQRNVAGRFQSLGAVSADKYVLSDYAALPLLSAPSWGKFDYYKSLGQGGSLERASMTFVSFVSGENLGSEKWKVDPKHKLNVWQPENHKLDGVYRRPIQTVSLVPEHKTPYVNLVQRGEPYLY